MAAGRVAGHADPVGIDVVRRGVRAQPAQRGLHVVDRGGVGELRRQAVGHRRGGVPVLGEHLAAAVPALALAGAEAAAMDAEDRRGFARRRLGPREVELQRLPARFRELDILLDHDLSGGVVHA